jgi:hypothetical protein
MTSGSGSKRGHLFSPSHQCLDICTRVRCCGETSSTGPFSLFHFLYMYRHRYQPQDPTQHPQRSRSREKLSALASGFSGLQPSCPKSPESSPESKDLHPLRSLKKPRSLLSVSYALSFPVPSFARKACVPSTSIESEQAFVGPTIQVVRHTQG